MCSCANRGIHALDYLWTLTSVTDQSAAGVHMTELHVRVLERQNTQLYTYLSISRQWESGHSWTSAN